MMYNKILIMEDAGRGKTTLSKKMSSKLNIKAYSTDDFFWKVKFTKQANKTESVKQIGKVYKKKKWIIEGTSRKLIAQAIVDSDLIIHLFHKKLIPQIKIVWKRQRKDKRTRLIDSVKFLKYLVTKHYELDRAKRKKHLRALLEPYKNKVIELHSFEDIDKFFENLKK